MKFPRPRHGVDLEKLVLQHGGHDDKESGMCVMEAASNYWFDIHDDDEVTGVHHWINEEMIELNDYAPSKKALQKLKVLIPDVVKTEGADIPDDLLEKYRDTGSWIGRVKVMRKIIHHCVKANKKRSWDFGSRPRTIKKSKPFKEPALVLDTADFDHETEGSQRKTQKA